MCKVELHITSSTQTVQFHMIYNTVIAAAAAALVVGHDLLSSMHMLFTT